jgi:hypothetical protein
MQASLSRLLITCEVLEKEVFSLVRSTCNGLIYRLGSGIQEGCCNVRPQVEPEFRCVWLTTIRANQFDQQCALCVLLRKHLTKRIVELRCEFAFYGLVRFFFYRALDIIFVFTLLEGKVLVCERHASFGSIPHTEVYVARLNFLAGVAFVIKHETERNGECRPGGIRGECDELVWFDFEVRHGPVKSSKVGVLHGRRNRDNAADNAYKDAEVLEIELHR